MKTSTEIKMYAHEVIISRSHLLPKTLIFRPESDIGGFLISFVISSLPETLEKISEASKKLENKDFELWFFEQETPMSLPKEIYSKRLYDFLGKPYKIEINCSSLPYQVYSESPPTYHVDVIFHTYETE